MARYEKRAFFVGFSSGGRTQDNDVLFGRSFLLKRIFFGKSVLCCEPGSGARTSRKG
jgi:hypothetical protein